MYVDQIANAYARSGHHVTVVTRSDSVSKVEQITDNYRVYRFKHCEGATYSRMGYWAALAFDIAEHTKYLIELDDIHPDIIEVQDYNALGYYLFQRRLAGEDIFKNLKLVVHMHTPTFKLLEINKNNTKKFPDYWIGEMEKFCLNAADGIVTQSEFLATDLDEYCSKKVSVIPLPYSMPEEKGRMHTEENTGILYIGRFEYRKGVLQLLKEFKLLWDSGSRASLTMIGGDTFFPIKKSWLREECKDKYALYIAKGLLRILDPVPPDALCRLISDSSFVIVPSLYENYPYACLMSMANRRPVLASSSGGQAEMVGSSEEVGLVFDWEISGHFREQLNRLLNLSEARLQEMGEAAFEKIKKISDPHRNVNARIDFFQSILENLTAGFPVPEYVKRLTHDGRPGTLSAAKCEVIKGRISIIVPYYNLGKYVNDTINSALSSDYENKEIIIINDGSNDERSLKVLEEIKKAHPFIKIINISNGGLANARNVGALAATGEFITFLDADDLVESNFYSKAVQILDRHREVSFVYSWLEYFDGASGVWVTYNTTLPFMACANMLSAFCIVRKADFISFGLNDASMDYGMEDYESWLRMVGKGCIGFSIPEVLVKYRVRADSMSRQFNRTMQRYLYEKLAEKNENIYKEYGAQIFQLLSSNGPGYFWNNPTFEQPELKHDYEYKDSPPISEAINYQRAELIRIAESKIGKKIISLAFKLKINRIFVN